MMDVTKFEAARRQLMSYPRNQGENPHGWYIKVQAAVLAGACDEEIQDEIAKIDKTTLQLMRRIAQLPPNGQTGPWERTTSEWADLYGKRGDIVFRELDQGASRKEICAKTGFSDRIVKYWYDKWAIARGVAKRKAREA